MGLFLVPAAIASIITAFGGDLAGSTATSQVVSGIGSGVAQVGYHATGPLTWDTGIVNPQLNQAASVGATGSDFFVSAQGAVTTGGNVALQGGTGTTTGGVKFYSGATQLGVVNNTASYWYFGMTSGRAGINFDASTNAGGQFFISAGSSGNIFLTSPTITIRDSGQVVRVTISPNPTTNFVFASAGSFQSANGSYIQLYSPVAGIIYLDATTQNIRDSGNGLCVTWSLASTGTSSLTIASTVTAFTFTQATHATIANPLTFQSGAVTTGTGSDLRMIAGAGSVAAGNVWLQGANTLIKDATGTTQITIAPAAATNITFAQAGQFASGNGNYLLFKSAAGNIYFDTPTLNFRDGGDIAVIAWALASSGATSMTIASTVTSFIMNYARAAGIYAIQFGGTSYFYFGTLDGGTAVFQIGNGASPTSNPANGVDIWALSGALKARGSSGTITTLAPADLTGFGGHCPKCGTDFACEWENDKYGSLTVCMHCLAEELGTREWIVRKKAA